MTDRKTHSFQSDPTFVAKSRSTWEILRRVAAYLRPYKLMAAGTIGCALFSMAFSLAYPKLTQFVIDDVIGQKRIDLLAPMMLALLGAFLLRDIFNSLRIRINNAFEQNVIYDMRCDVYARLQRLPVNYFDQRASGDLMTRIVEDVNAVERVLIDGTEQGSVAVLAIIGVAAIMFATNPALAAIAMVPLPLLTLGALWYTLTAHRRYQLQRRAASAMKREPHEDKRFARCADDLRAGTLGIMRAWAAYSPAMTFAGALGMVLVLWAGGRQVLADKMTIGQLVGFLFYLALFYEPISRLHGLNQLLQAARAAGERVFDILDTAVERAGDLPRQKLRTPVRGDVVYQDVGFSYNPERVVLRNISLHVRPGEMVALAGPTGAGKSTLVNLLPAFYEATAGRITIDGQDISGISLESLRAHISVVSQEAFLFNGTIRENILYGRLDATEAELVAASRAANCHEFIERLPLGYDSRVGERGVKPSVGEKQRVSIARALLKNAPILILDEATASVDTATERLIQEALEHLMANRTSFVIAHRLSTIRKAGQILVMQHGQIIEMGTHAELLELNGLYSRLARIQGTTFIEEVFERLGVQQNG
jgi:ABC-type multidrug transport system fused ATPase/permease subunit